MGFTYTPFLGTIYSEMPSKTLLEKFRRVHAEHQEELYEQSRKGQTVQERRKADQLEQTLKPKQTFEDVVKKAKLILPQILNDKAWSDQGRINMPETMKLLKISQNTAYRARRELLKHYHEQDSTRASQWGTDTTAEKPS
jgi:Fic family protein